MLQFAQVITTLPATDLKRAKKFYENTLGLKPVRSEDGQIMFNAGNGNIISIYERKEPTKADHTVLTFEVKNLESEIKGLENQGIKFEDYDLPEIKTEKHIAKKGNDKAAWFKDTEGNIICIHETVS